MPEIIELPEDFVSGEALQGEYEDPPEDYGVERTRQDDYVEVIESDLGGDDSDGLVASMWRRVASSGGAKKKRTYDESEESSVDSAAESSIDGRGRPRKRKAGGWPEEEGVFEMDLDA